MKQLRTISVILFLALLAFLYFQDTLLSDRVFSFRDLSRYYYPLRSFAFEQIKSGSFPLWNPFSGCGHPIFASLQSCILYPLSIVYLLPDFDSAFNFFIILHIFLGGVFFYLLMRYLKFGYICGLIAALTFMFSGYLIAVINLTTTLSAAIWFPLVFIFYDLSLKKKKFVYTVLTSFFLGMMFLGGEPTPFAGALFILAVYSLTHLISHKKEYLGVTLRFFAAIFIFILLFAFQSIPFIELIGLSSRNYAQFENATHWSFPPRDMMNFLLPFFYGPLTLDQTSPLRQDWILLSYLGVIPLILCFIAGFFRRDNLTSFFKIIFLSGLILIFGKYTPIYKIAYKYLPFFGLIRYPVKFFFLSAVSFAYLSGAGWQEYLSRIEKQDKRFFKAMLGLFIACFLTAFLFLIFYQFKEYFLSKTTLDDFLQFSVNFYNLRRTLVFFILASLLLYLGARKKLNLTLTGALLLALTFIDFYGVKNIDVNPAVSRSILHKTPPNILFLEKDKGLFRVYASNKMNKQNEFLRGIDYGQALFNSLDNFTSNRLMEHSIYDARGYFSIHLANYSKVLNLADTAPMPSSTNILNMLNVKYILTPEEIKDKSCKLLKQDYDSFLYQNKKVLPRAYLVPEYIVLKEELEISDKLKAKDFNPAKTVILEEEPCQHYAKGKRYKLRKKEYVEIVKYSPNEVEIKTFVCKKPKFLLLADNYYPGWRVSVDGKPAKLYKANFTLRAVYLSLGEHKVRFFFSSPAFKTGVAISLCTLFFIILVFLARAIILNRGVSS